MAHCRICGASTIEGDGPEVAIRYRARTRSVLCNACAEDIPDKVGREEFEQAYWGDELQHVPFSTRKEFYEDYLLSYDTLEAYIKSTTTYVA